MKSFYVNFSVSCVTNFYRYQLVSCESTFTQTTKGNIVFVKVTLLKLGTNRHSDGEGCYLFTCMDCSNLGGRSSMIASLPTCITEYVDKDETAMNRIYVGFFSLCMRAIPWVIMSEGSAGSLGVGLLILQQFGGVNGISFYASSIFVSADTNESFGSNFDG